MTTFIDKDTGAEWEEILKGDKTDIREVVAIRPVKVEPKWSVSMSKNFRNNDGLWYIDINSGTEVFDQAQLIKQSVESLMHYLMSDSDLDLQALDKARNTMKGDQ